MDKPFSFVIEQPGGTAIPCDLPPGTYMIGSAEGNQIRLRAAGIGERHARLVLGAAGGHVEDLGARHKTLVDGERLAAPVPLAPGMRIEIGPYALIVMGVPTVGNDLLSAALATPPATIPSAVAPAASAAPADTPSPPAVPSATAPACAARKAAPAVPPSHPTPAATVVPAAPPPDDPQLLLRREIKNQIHRELVQRLDLKRLTAARVNAAELQQRARDTLASIIDEIRAKLPPGIDPAQLATEIFNEALRLGPLESLLADDSVTEIMVNGPHQVYVERGGKLMRTDQSFMDDASVLAIIERIVSPLGRRIDESQPYVDARLPDGSRVNAIIPPLSLTGPTLTIRKFSAIPLGEADLIGFGTWTAQMAAFLRASVRLRKNIVVSGGTGSGKTTLLNVLSAFIPPSDRIVTIEDAAELRLEQPHLVRLEARPPNIEGRGAITIRNLVANSLRMRPDRIIVGECRGGEALDMLQAMNTGHDGSLTTVHSNSPRDVIARLETMVMMSGMELPSRAIREQIASAIDLVVHEARFSDGSRRITHITEIMGLEGTQIVMQDIFTFTQTGIDAGGRVLGAFRPTGAVPSFFDQLKSRGIPLDIAMFQTSPGEVPPS